MEINTYRNQYRADPNHDGSVDNPVEGGAFQQRERGLIAVRLAADPGENEMADVLAYGLLLVALIGGGVMVYPSILRIVENRKQFPSQSVVKRDWLPTGRIDFATNIKADAKGSDQPSEFKLLVEERRIVESVAGNENLEIQWRLATLKEAKEVITQYHKCLLENSLIKSVSDSSASSPPLPTAQDGAKEFSGSSLGSETKEDSVGH